MFILSYSNIRILAKTWTRPEGEDKEGDPASKSGAAAAASISDQVRATAEQVTRTQGMVYEETSGLYYDYTTGYYYDSERKLYYDGNAGIWYTYSYEEGKYVVHSTVEAQVEAAAAEKPKKSSSKKKKKKSKKSSKRRRKYSGESSNDSSGDAFEKEAAEVIELDDHWRAGKICGI